jgi:RNA polymerase sigma-70 factor (ECF subfamily)
LTLARDVAGAGAESIEDFVDRVLPAAYQLATSILGDPVAAEDVAHDAVLSAWEHRSALRDPGSLDAWFARIVGNKCRDRLRERSRHPIVVLAVEPAGSTPDISEALADRDEIGRAIGRLTPDEQVVLALRFGHDLEVAEIARRLGEPEGTIKSRLHLARQRLRAALAVSRVGPEDVR